MYIYYGMYDVHMYIPRESLKGGGKMVWPTKVKNLVVETRDVIAPFGQVEYLKGGRGRGREGEGRERERERERRKSRGRYQL